jgi:hypothetical protein
MKFLPLPNLVQRPAGWLVAGIGALISLVWLGLYLGGEARGRMDFLTLPAVHWGTPASQAAHGLGPLYLDPRESGWDGQFYYRMANDPLGREDAPDNIDSPSYRYQRIGMPGTAWLLSKLALRNWVTPTAFYLTSWLALFISTWALAAYYRRNDVSPWFALVWSLAVGPQLTMLNGLPDGFAEAMVVVAVLALARTGPRPLIYAAAMSLAVLSREAYVAAAGLIAVIHVLRLMQGEDTIFLERAKTATGEGWSKQVARRVQNLYSASQLPRNLGHVVCLATPLAAFGAWQVYIRIHFGKAPSEQAGGVLAPFLEQYFRFLKAALSGQHPVWGNNLPDTHREALMLFVFAFLLGLYVVIAVITVRRVRSFRHPATLTMAFAPVIALYFFFGHVVMMHYSGYLKAANIVLFLAPFTIAALSLKSGIVRTGLLGLTAFCGVAGAGQFVYDKILIGSINGARPSTIYENGRFHSGTVVTTGQAPLKNFAASVKIVGNSSFYGREAFRELRGIPQIQIFDVEITNQGNEPYALADGVGAVRLSYHWLTLDGKNVIQDGRRSFFQAPLPPGQTKNIPLYVEFPTTPGRYRLRISLVQEGVAWFYHQGTGYTDLVVTIP